MDVSLNTKLSTIKQEESASTPTPAESPPYTTCSGFRPIASVESVPSPKRRRGADKRVVTIPMEEVQGSRLKGETTPPSDSWSWRKYGQKPIKGSPYPRGYYRCSSSKGCPARKQVERSCLDPSILIVTYSSHHNHPPKTSKRTSSGTPVAATSPSTPPDPDPQPAPENKSDHLSNESLITPDQFSCFGDVDATQLTLPRSRGFSKSRDDDVSAMAMPMKEEDELLFADLEELPECSAVFGRRLEEEERCLYGAVV